MSRRGALLGVAPAHSRRLGPGAQTHMTRSFAPLVCPFLPLPRPAPPSQLAFSRSAPILAL